MNLKKALKVIKKGKAVKEQNEKLAEIYASLYLANKDISNKIKEIKEELIRRDVDEIDVPVYDKTLKVVAEKDSSYFDIQKIYNACKDERQVVNFLNAVNIVQKEVKKGGNKFASIVEKYKEVIPSEKKTVTLYKLEVR